MWHLNCFLQEAKWRKKHLYFKDGGLGHYWSNGKKKSNKDCECPSTWRERGKPFVYPEMEAISLRLTSAAHKSLSHTCLYCYYLFIRLFPLLIWKPFKNRVTFCSLLVILDLTAKLLSELVTMDQLSCRRILSVLPGNISWHRDSWTWSKCVYFIDWDLRRSHDQNKAKFPDRTLNQGLCFWEANLTSVVLVLVIA